MKKFFKKISVFGVLVFLCSGRVIGQGPQLVSLIPPSPNVMAMQKYGDIPVSAYTGIPDISIPIYTIKFKDITVPISISYHAGGIKVTEEASQVGLGWVLNAGGSISRNVLGADDFNSATYFDNTIQDFSNGQLVRDNVQLGCNLNMINASIPTQNTAYNYSITNYLTGSPPKDFQPDQFYYNIPGHSGKFILKRNMQAVLQKQENIQITCLAADGSTWQIKSADGYIYDFIDYETYMEATPHKSAWYLKKITSPAGNTVTFNYTTFNTSTSIQSLSSFTETRDDADFSYPPIRAAYNTGSQSGLVPGKQYVNKVLSSIDFTNGKVVFTYLNNRTDLPNEQKLDNIAIFNQAETIPFKTVAFSYDYFNGMIDASVAGNTTQRLKLTQLIETGTYNGQSIQNPPYVFTYNESNLPAKISFGRDHWGYFNGVTGKGSLIPSTTLVNTTDQIQYALGLMGPERDPNPFFMGAFMLNMMKYPTGGATEFQYEANDFDEIQSEVNDHGYFANNTYSTIQKSASFAFDGPSRTYRQSPNTLDLTNEFVSNGVSTNVTINAYFLFTGGSGGNCNDITGGNTGLIYFILKDANGNEVNRVDPFASSLCNGSNSPCVGCQVGGPFTYNNTYSLGPGIYTWQAFVGTSGAALKLSQISATYKWYEPSVTPNQFNTTKSGGGLRIKRIIDHDGVNEYNNKIRRYDYHYMADKTNSGTKTEFSFGRRMAKPQYCYFVPNVGILGVKVGNCTYTGFFTIHLMRSSDSNTPLNGSASGAAVGYDQVTEYLGENGEAGKKIYKYNNSPDIIVNYNEPFTGHSFPMRPPYNSNLADPLNGSLINEIDYVNIKGSYFKAKEIVNQYATVLSNENVVYAVENRMTPNELHADDPVCDSNLPPLTCDSNSLTLSSKAMRSEWNYLTSTSEKLYNEKGDELHYAESLTNYYYDNPNHLQLTRTLVTNSKGEKITNNFRYPGDFTIPGGATDAFSLGLNNLLSKHVLNTPIESYTQKVNAVGDNIGVTSYGLTSFNSTLPVPATAYVSMLSAPNSSFAISTINGTGLVKDAAYQPVISFDNYDAFGNLNQQHKINDLNHSYLWDYNNALVVAEVSNAAINEIAYTGFEADGTGRWTIPSTTRTASGITGNQSYTFNGTAITGIVPSGKNYVVSYWSQNGTLLVNGTSGIAGTAKGAWTYWEHSLPNTTTTITVSGTTQNIDELRLYPAGSLMTTYAYYPAIGLLNMCDPNSNLVYYQYDGLGRLKVLKDGDGNILKTYIYNYQGQIGN